MKTLNFTDTFDLVYDIDEDNIDDNINDNIDIYEDDNIEDENTYVYMQDQNKHRNRDKRNIGKQYI